MEDFSKLDQFNKCVYDNPEKKRKKISKEKRDQSASLLKCLNKDNNYNFSYWGSVATNMASYNSDVDIFADAAICNKKKLLGHISDCMDNNCDYYSKKDIPTCQKYDAFTCYIDDLKIDTSIQYCFRKTSYEYSCLKSTNSFQKDLIWCMNNQLKADKPKKKLLDKTIISDYPSVLNTCDFVYKEKK